MPLDVAYLADLVRIRIDLHVFDQEKDVVQLVLAPHTVAHVRVQHAGEVVKVLRLALVVRDAQLDVQAPLCRPLHPDRVVHLQFVGEVVQRVAAARVGVQVREGDLESA